MEPGIRFIHRRGKNWRKHGISCKGKRAVQLKKEDYEKYDYILGMDPWYTGRFDVTYADVVEGCEAFLDYLEKMKKL